MSFSVFALDGEEEYKGCGEREREKYSSANFRHEKEK